MIGERTSFTRYKRWLSVDEANAMVLDHPRLETDRLVLIQVTSAVWQAVMRLFSDAEMLRCRLRTDRQPGAGRRCHPLGKPCLSSSAGVWGLFAAESEALIGTLSYVKLEEENSALHRAETGSPDWYWTGLMVAPSEPIPYVFDQMCVARTSFVHPKNLRSASVLLKSVSA
jgi:hypothetical protein